MVQASLPQAPKLSEILARIAEEDLSQAEALLQQAPAEQFGWRPPWPSASGSSPFSLQQLAAHLVEAAGAYCACFLRAHPDTGSSLSSLHMALGSVSEAPMETLPSLFRLCRIAAAEAWEETTDEDLARPIRTHFHPEGEALLIVLQKNAKHLNHHTHQLFLYLKLLGLPLTSRDLYRFETLPQ
jgi:uncharacterized damage-inducible protein DinB